ncbi:MAG: HAMP domain-containing sensor histidine kinase [Bdellovibrionia bacterium]
MISDLLDITRLEAHSLRLEQGNCDFIQLVQEVIESYETFAKEKRIQLKSEIPSESQRVFCDPERTIQILTNLVDNAFKFTNTGGSIQIYVKSLNHHVEVRVTDTGKGIQQEHLPYIFDRFWQAKDNAHKGTGLGLAIAKGLVVPQGGKMWVESEYGIGTTFYFTLPKADQLKSTFPSKAAS